MPTKKTKKRNRRRRNKKYSCGFVVLGPHIEKMCRQLSDNELSSATWSSDDVSYDIVKKPKQSLFQRFINFIKKICKPQQ